MRCLAASLLLLIATLCLATASAQARTTCHGSRHARHHGRCASPKRHAHSASAPTHHPGTATSPTAPGTGSTPVPSTTTAGPSGTLEVGAADTQCTLFASPAGSDGSGDGSLGAPFASIKALDAALAPGQTGCLEAGTYGSTSTWDGLASSGTASAPITITAAPGVTATVVGAIELDGSYTTISHLEIDGSNSLFTAYPASEASCSGAASLGLAIQGQNDILEYDDYYESSFRGQGIGVGWSGDADNTIIRYDKIHDVGSCDFYDHLIYLGSGNNVQIYDNWLWNDPNGWGIKLDPGPTNARIWNNVIDAAGSGFNFGNSSGSQPTAGNQVWNNIVMNSVGVNNPDINWSYQGVLVTSPGGLLSGSTGNQVYNNDSYNNAGGMTDVSRDVPSSQLSVTGNVTTNPNLADPAAHDYAPTANTPAAFQGLWNGQ